jgi:hypothetical protein
LLCPYESKLYDFCLFFSLYVKHIEHQSHAVWKFAEFSNVCDHLLQQQQLRSNDSFASPTHITNPIILPFLQQRNFEHVFQHDNERCHVARVCQDFLNQNHIRVLPWAALSPDLSPIEHLWDELGRRVRHRQNQQQLRSNDSFASPTHITNQALDKELWDVIPLLHKSVTQLL